MMTSRKSASDPDRIHGRAARYGRGPNPAPRDSAARDSGSPESGEPSSGPPEANAGWTIFTYLLAGMLAYGLLGWVVARFTHLSVLFPIGMVVGLVLAIVLIIFKYGRP
jgi:ATP synthase protein I